MLAWRWLLRTTYRPARALAIGCAWLMCGALTAAQEAPPKPAEAQANPAANPQRRSAHLIKVAAPIRDVQRIERAVRRFVADARAHNQWPLLVFEIDNGATALGPALDLARFLSSDELDGATTVAFLPKGATGHNVLVAIACDEIAMPSDAEIGEAGASERSIGPDLRDVYYRIAQRRRTIPPDVVLGMLDPRLEVLQVETEVSREYILRERLPELEKERAVQATKVLIRAGEAGRFTGREAKELGFISVLADDRAALARVYGLSAAALDDDAALAVDWRPIRVRVAGPITTGLAQQTQRMIDKEMRDHGANFIVLEIDSAGGAPLDSVNLANHLADLDRDRVRTVAFIAGAAQADSAFLALACDQIVMAPGATLGGDWTRKLPADEAATLARVVGEIARRKGRSPALAMALTDPAVEVFRYEHAGDGASDYFTPQQVNDLKDAIAWKQADRVTTAGKHLQLSGAQAVELGLARATAKDWDEFNAIYSLESAPRLVEPSWVDRLVQVLNSSAAGWALLALAAIGLYIEVHTPGLGAGGFTAGLCFLLFFWSHHLGGTADWLEILLFAAGVACILLEVLVLPGVGVFAFGGGALILVSVLLASQTFIFPRDEYEAAQLFRSLAMFSGVFVGFIVAAVFVKRLLPGTPGFGQMVLAPPSAEEQQVVAQREALAKFDHLRGATGSAVTPLCPAGKARFDSELVDVLADGEFLPAGSPVRVVEVRGHRVVVRLDQRAASLG
jgi:membrane-bound serine protease (ClpP class)